MSKALHDTWKAVHKRLSSSTKHLASARDKLAAANMVHTADTLDRCLAEIRQIMQGLDDCIGGVQECTDKTH